MNSVEKAQFEVLDQTLALRYELLDVVTDDDLCFELPGNCSLGAMCREVGQYQSSYIESFRTFVVDWTQKPAPKATEESVSALRVWYGEMDAELKEVLRSLSETDIQNRTIDRSEFNAPVLVHLHIYRESILIFAGKVDIYLRALGAPRPKQWSQWIG